MKRWGILIAVILLGYVFAQSPGQLQQKNERPIEIKNTPIHSNRITVQHKGG